jgi:hypothetical protein
MSSRRVGPGPIGIASGDFKGDGFPDLVAANYGRQTISVLVNDVARDPGAVQCD